MKQLLFLLLFPCLALAQYTGNAGQKITLGEQTTADGLVFRGVASIDTVTATSKITRANKQDTSAFLLLDTVTNLLWHYKTASNGWIQAGGGVSVSSFSAGTTGLTPTGETTGAVTLGGTLAVANGGTGQSTLTANKVMVGNGTTGVLNPTNLHWDNTNSRLGIGTASPTFKIETSGGGAKFASNSDGDNLIEVRNTGTSTSPTYGYGGMIFQSNAVNSGTAYPTTNLHTAAAAFNCRTGLASPVVGLAFHYNGYAYYAGNVGIAEVSPVERLHINGNARINGNISVGSATPTTSGTGITFPATQSASTNVNTLDDYEEGTWTTTFGTKVNLTGTPVLSEAKYRKIGQLVYIEGTVTGLSLTSTNTETYIQMTVPINMNTNTTSQVGNVYTFTSSLAISGVISDWSGSDKTNLGIIIPAPLITSTGSLIKLLFSITYISEN